MPTKFCDVSNIFWSVDGGTTYTRLSDSATVELTPDDETLDGLVEWAFKELSLSFDMWRIDGVTNNFLRKHGRRAIRWRKMI